MSLEDHKQRRPLVLASASPRRRELLGRLGIPLRIIVSDVEELEVATSGVARDLALLNARRKAEAVAARAPAGALVLAADTVVVLEEQALGKPADPPAALEMLARLSGRTHQVITAFVLLEAPAGACEEHEVCTDVTFKTLSTAERLGYVATGEPFDKAGGYGIQGTGAFLVRAIHGSYTSVVGLPLTEVLEALRRMGGPQPFGEVETEATPPCPPVFRHHSEAHLTHGEAAAMNDTDAQGYRSMLERVEDAAARSGRAGQVRLLAVSKTQPVERLLEPIAQGCRSFGENYVQELVSKSRALATHPDLPCDPADLEWHFIGHLQTNKVRAILPGVTLIHSVDRLSLIEELARRAAALGKVQDILLEINLGGEASKSGATEDQAAALADEILQRSSLRMRGLMAIPPPVADPEQARPYFRRLRALRDALEARLSLPLPELSMGMSADFEVAIEEGATLVRIGTAIFGHRPARLS